MQEKLGHVICYREKSEGYKNKIRRIGCVWRGRARWCKRTKSGELGVCGADVRGGVKEQNQENWVLGLILPLVCCIARRRGSHFPSRPY